MGIETKNIKLGWNFENSYVGLPEIFFTKMALAPVGAPKLVVLNHLLAESLGLDVEELVKDEAIDVFAGNVIPKNAIPLAQAYAGHQFGHFTMLGDGRAMLLGEQITPKGERLDIQLKGSGKTPYSRSGDGRAVLGPMLREYIISEAMHALQIPTTRSLAVVSTGEKVLREKEDQGAILTRVAASHLRVGTFEYAARWASTKELRDLADYTIQRHFTEGVDKEDKYLFLLQQVIKRQASLIAKWQLVGFIHGVMNTDNVAISGETIDYGPCAFMDKYDPATVFSSIDRYGRYAYGNQPLIAAWNLAVFASTLLPLLHQKEEEAIQIAKEAISEFDSLYYQYWMLGMRGKLGIFNEEAEDDALIQELLKMMEKYQADYTNTFVALTFDAGFDATDVTIDTNLFQTQDFNQWHQKWQARLKRQEQTKEMTMQLMKAHNPAIIPRNHLVEEAIQAAVEQGDYSVMHKLLDVLSKPYAHSKNQEKYAHVAVSSDLPYRTFCGT